MKNYDFDNQFIRYCNNDYWFCYKQYLYSLISNSNYNQEYILNLINKVDHIIKEDGLINIESNLQKCNEFLDSLNYNYAITCNEGIYPIHTAAYLGAVHIGIELTTRGANLNSCTTVPMTGDLNPHAFSFSKLIHNPLTISIFQKNHLFIRWLCLQNIDLNYEMSKEGHSVLHAASFTGSTYILKLLLEKGATKTCSRDGDTLLMWACGNGQFDMAMLLIKSGFDPFIRNNCNQDALTFSVRSGNLLLTKYLLELGLDPNLMSDFSEQRQRDSSLVDASPLIITQNNSSVEMLKLLDQYTSQKRKYIL